MFRRALNCFAVLVLLAGNASAAILYVSTSGGTIQRITSDGVSSTFASGLDRPSGLAFDGEGNLAVNDLGRIVKITPGGTQSVFANDALISHADAIAYDSAGNLFVGGGRMAKVAPDGVVTALITAPFFPYTNGMAFDPSGSLYVAASNGSGLGIYRVPPGGSIRPSFISGLNFAGGLAFDRAGNLFLADGNSIKKVASGTTGAVVTYSGLHGPWGLAFGDDGFLYMADELSNQIVKIAPDGTSSIFATIPSAYGLPTYLAFTDDNGVPLKLPNQVPEPAGIAVFAIGGWVICRRPRTPPPSA